MLTPLITAGVLICSFLLCLQLVRYIDFIRLRSRAGTVTFPSGVCVDGQALDGMSLEDAIGYWQGSVEPQYSGRTVTFSDGTRVTAADLDYSSDYREVLTGLASETLGTRLRDRLRGNGKSRKDPSVARVFCTDRAAAAYAKAAAEKFDEPAREPVPTGFDPESMQFTFSQGSVGRLLDQARLKEELISAMNEGGGNVELRFTEVQPSCREEELASRYGLRAFAVTSARSSSSNRISNIRTALKAIDGCRLEPDEEFSFNTVVGKRTAERGYKTATAYSGGEVTEELGGGICQVSTTLFNAAAKADLNVTERHNHSIPVHYVDLGKDATVNWGGQDLRFVNTSGGPLWIRAYLDEDKKVRVGFFGLLIENGESFTLEAETTETTPYEIRTQTNAFLLPGESNVVRQGRIGYKAVLWKCRKNAQGETISREEYFKSRYPGRDEIIETGP